MHLSIISQVGFNAPETTGNNVPGAKYSCNVLIDGHRGSDCLPTEQPKTSADAKIGVYEAGPDVLLPFLQRAEEVRMLLQDTCPNSLLHQQLENVFNVHPQDWQILQTTLFELDRDQVPDLEWLQKLRAIIFPRAPPLWCRLSQAIGADFVSLDHGRSREPQRDNDGLNPPYARETRPYEADIECGSPACELIKELPHSLQRSINSIVDVPFDECQSVAKEPDRLCRIDTQSTPAKQETRCISAKQEMQTRVGFRFTFSALIHNKAQKNNSLNINEHSGSDTKAPQTGLVDASDVTDASLLFKQHKLSCLFTPYFDQNAEKHKRKLSSSPINIPQNEMDVPHEW